MRFFAEIDIDLVFNAFEKHGIFWAVIVCILVVGWLVGREMLSGPIADHFFLRHVKRRLLKKQFVEDLVSETFEGKVELVTSKLLRAQASRNRVLQYYGGAKLDWDIIAANGDIPRDQLSELRQITLTTPSMTRLLCVTAEAGAGKSTIAWRVVADLARHDKNLVIIHVTANEDADVWQRMPEFTIELNRPLLILTDDIFRGEDASNSFINLAPNLSATILATSRRNEFRTRAKRLKFECVEFKLNPPSADEKKRIVNSLGKNTADLTPEQRQRLDVADQFIVLMIELVGGKELHEVVRDSIDTLYRLEPNHSAYRAYCYLCFAGQFSISMPVSLLETLDREFCGLMGRPAVEGLIFVDSRNNFLRSGHSVLAKAAADIYATEKGRTPKQIIGEIISAINNTNLEERRYFGRLLTSLATAKLLEPNVLFTLAKDSVSICVRNAERIDELIVLREFYLCCGQVDLAEACFQQAIGRELASQDEGNLLLHLCRERGNEKAALTPIAQSIQKYPNQGEARAAYLGLVDKYARNDITNVIQEMDKWLDANQADTFTRNVFVLFVDRKQPNLIGYYIKQLEKWLDQHPEDGHLRVAYLHLIEKRGTATEIHEAIVKAGK